MTDWEDEGDETREVGHGADGGRPGSTGGDYGEMGWGCIVRDEARGSSRAPSGEGGGESGGGDGGYGWILGELGTPDGTCKLIGSCKACSDDNEKKEKLRRFVEEGEALALVICGGRAEQ